MPAMSDEDIRQAVHHGNENDQNNCNSSWSFKGVAGSVAGSVVGGMYGVAGAAKSWVSSSSKPPPPTSPQRQWTPPKVYRKGDVVWHERRYCHGTIVHADTMLLNGVEIHDYIIAIDHCYGEPGRELSARGEDLEPYKGQNLEGYGRNHGY